MEDSGFRDVKIEVGSEKALKSFLDKIDFAKQNGLVPAVAQDYYSGEILMLAYMNREALKKTLETGYAHYFSRSRNELWKKGGTSGHVQFVKEMFFDCDSDSILIKIEQAGPACHTGHKSCFYFKVENDLGNSEENYNYEGKIKDREIDYKKFYSLKLIFDVIKGRKGIDPQKSYVASLLTSGLEKIGKKLQEESLELILSVNKGKKEDVVYEAADLLFFLMVIMAFAGVDFSLIVDELRRREGVSGIDEKNSREK